MALTFGDLRREVLDSVAAGISDDAEIIIVDNASGDQYIPNEAYGDFIQPTNQPGFWIHVNLWMGEKKDLP